MILLGPKKITCFIVDVINVHNNLKSKKHAARMYKRWKVELRSYQVVMRHTRVVGRIEGITSTEKHRRAGLLLTRLQWKPRVAVGRITKSRKV